MASSSASLSILRIKRKHNQTPLDALLIEHAEPSSKRQRQIHDTTTPAIVSPVSSPSRGIFRFAATVSLDSFDTEKKTRQVRDRISAFIRYPPPLVARAASTSLSSTPTHSPNAGSHSRKLPSSVRAVRSSALESGTTSPARRTERVADKVEESKRARYRIVEGRRDEATAAAEMRRGPLPPKVISSADAEEADDKFRIYDAIEESDSPRVRIIPSVDEDADAASSFASMLEEYLTLQDRQTQYSSRVNKMTETVGVSGNDVKEGRTVEDAAVGDVPVEDGAAEGESGDFVYDVYYRDMGDRVDTARVNSDGVDVASGSGIQRIGKLAGLEEDEIVTNEIESEEEDEADQDSNEENDYRNDYPSDGDSEDASADDSDRDW